MPALRGDYASIGADYIVEQDWGAYSPAQHALYRRLYSRQSALVPRYACAEFTEALTTLDAADGIPKFDLVNRKLRATTRWEIVAVPGLVPDEVFFAHLANRRFPVTVWLRREDEFDYIVEPDVFHDFFGHVPLLMNPIFADHLQAYGHGGLKAQRLNAVKFLARLYWYTIEFGLIRTSAGIKAYGAGILSSGGELRYAIDDPRPVRREFDLVRIMQSEYHIDRMQAQYFVIDSFEHLFRATEPDFTPIYERLAVLPTLPATPTSAP